MSRSEAFGSERELVEACLAGDQAAWAELFARYKGRILEAVKKALGKEVADKNLVDELDAEVRALLFLDEVLANFNPRKGNLEGFLVGFAKKRVTRYFQERPRKRRLKDVSKVEKPDPAGMVWPKGILLEELRNSLSPTEKLCLDVFTGKEPASVANKWSKRYLQKLIERICKKWEDLQNRDRD